MKLVQVFPFKARWVGAGGLVVAGLLAIAAIIYSATENARVELDQLAQANADERIWQVVAVEAKVHRFQHSVLNMHEPMDKHLIHLREEYEDLKAALASICDNPEFASIKAVNTAGASLQEAERVLTQIDPIVASDFERDPVAMETLVNLSFDLAEVAEAISLSALPAFTELAQAQRDRVAGSLLELGVIIVILVIVLFCSVVILLYSIRAGAGRTRQITSTRNRLNAIIGTSLDGILVVGREGEILDYNGAAERIFGYTTEEAIGQKMSELIVPEHFRAAHDAGMKRYLETREKRVIDGGLIQLEAIDKTGRLFPVELSISSAESEEGEIFVSYIRDISDRVAAQAELVDARDKAVAGEQAKAKFLAVMSHEMRTPLNGLLGSLQLLQGTKLSPRQRNFTGVMETSGQLLMDHVNNVLDISRADAGQVTAVRQDFDLDDLMAEVVTSLKGQAKARGNTLAFKHMGDPAGLASGDRGRLSQVLVNLIGNAIKFTSDGQISVEMEREAGADMVEFRVIDTGIGIDPDDQARVFDDFVMIDSSFQREVEGTGLGLGIVRRLVEILGGEIGVESAPGQGSVFWFRVPMPVAQAALDDEEQATDTAASGEANLNVLLVEDNEINRLVAREMLSHFGCTITEATDGREGVEKASETAFDLILCDISMPRMDGIEATGLIRSGVGPNAQTPIVALTAHALPEDIERFRAAGMSDVVVKPLTFEELERVIGLFAAPSSPDTESDPLTAILGADRAKEILAQANAELSEGFTQLRSMASKGAEREELRQLAHKLAGVAAVVGYGDLHGHLKELETASVAEPTDKLMALIAETEKAFDAL